MPKFVLKDGQLSQYAFACGYIQRASETGDNNYMVKRFDLYNDGCYHVQGYDFEQNARLCWESFNNITDARKFWKLMTREHSLIPHKN